MNFFKKREENKTMREELAEQAADWWTSKLEEANVSTEQLEIFRVVLKNNIMETLKNWSGFVTIHTMGDELCKAAEAAKIEGYPENYFPDGGSMNIDELGDINKCHIDVHIGGKQETTKIR